ncbi:hypothetical protein DY000_02021898 [Brassica cretica]|uniref:Uncharacterized protein n=1 Tax=Brassica cretica TaxID=69181 RepID=A0ABQ7EI79_BRACR|nr:hypothetical protein DY000_02021898 [Brassica cretica]
MQEKLSKGILAGKTAEPSNFVKHQVGSRELVLAWVEQAGSNNSISNHRSLYSSRAESSKLGSRRMKRASHRFTHRSIGALEKVHDFSPELQIVHFNPVYAICVGDENSYDEVNVQIPAEYKYVIPQQIMLGQENVATPATDRSEYDDQNTDEPSSVITQLPSVRPAWSLRSDRAFVPLGHYVTTELEPSLVAM